MRPKFRYANVAATLALFLALSTGTAYAVNEWTGANIVNDSLTGADIREATLAKVPDADKLDGIDSKGFIQGGTAAACCWAKSSGKTYFNRVHTSLDGPESTIPVVPHLLHLKASCSSSGPISTTSIVADTAGLGLFMQRTGQVAQMFTFNVGDSTTFNAAGTEHFTIQAGTGADSQSGQRLVTIELFADVSPSGCIHQFSALLAEQLTAGPRAEAPARLGRHRNRKNTAGGGVT